jgi:hypothetical protein
VNTLPALLRDAYNVLLEKSERKRQLARPRRRWEGNIQRQFKKFDGKV